MGHSPWNCKESDTIKPGCMHCLSHCQGMKSRQQSHRLLKCAQLGADGSLYPAVLVLFFFSFSKGVDLLIDPFYLFISLVAQGLSCGMWI